MKILKLTRSFHDPGATNVTEMNSSMLIELIEAGA